MQNDNRELMELADETVMVADADAMDIGALSVVGGSVEDADFYDKNDVSDDEFEQKLDRIFQQGDDAIATLDRACQDFERSMDGFTDGLEKMFDSFEGMLEVAFKK